MALGAHLFSAEAKGKQAATIAPDPGWPTPSPSPSLDPYM